MLGSTTLDWYGIGYWNQTWDWLLLELLFLVRSIYRGFVGFVGFVGCRCVEVVGAER